MINFFPKRKSYKQLEKELEDTKYSLKRLRCEVRSLEFMHKRLKDVYTYPVEDGYESAVFQLHEKLGCDEHPPLMEVVAETSSAGKVTLEELARFVIDGTPIKREKTAFDYIYPNNKFDYIYPNNKSEKHIVVDLNSVPKGEINDEKTVFNPDGEISQ